MASSGVVVVVVVVFIVVCAVTVFGFRYSIFGFFVGTQRIQFFLNAKSKCLFLFDIFFWFGIFFCEKSKEKKKKKKE